MKLRLHFSALVVVALALVTFSCDLDDRNSDLAPTATALIEDQDPDGVQHHHDDPLVGFEAEIVNHVEDHAVNLDDLERVSIERPDGTVDEVYMLEGDIEAIRKWIRPSFTYDYLS